MLKLFNSFMMYSLPRNEVTRVVSIPKKHIFVGWQSRFGVVPNLLFSFLNIVKYRLLVF